MAEEGFWRSRRRRHPGLGYPKRSSNAGQANRTVPIGFAMGGDRSAKGVGRETGAPGREHHRSSPMEFGFGAQWVETASKRIEPAEAGVARARDSYQGTAQLSAIQAVAPSSEWSWERE